LPYEARLETDKGKLLLAALLHDIGKIKTPDSVLNKDGGLSEREWEIMKRHPKDRTDMIVNTVFGGISDWILYHHERLDGKDYFGLREKAIPFESRIIAVADTFSALRTYRIYRPAKPIDDVIDILNDVRGSQLAPLIVDSFLSLDKKCL
jgi:HD-GYP domain-containing protein (c-di-GMP phosphodiesterase class II)